MTAIVKSVIWLGLVVSAIIAGIALLPSGSKYPVPSEFHTSFETIRGYVNALNEIMPLDTIRTIIVWSIGILFVTKIAYPLVMWLISKVTAIQT